MTTNLYAAILGEILNIDKTDAILKLMNYKYADIVVNKPLFRTFTYSIPDALKGSLSVGSRVRVTFRNRKITGYVVRLLENIDDEIRDKLKDIIEILGPYPVMNAELLKLTEWMAKYYVSPWGDVIKAALPEDSNIKTVRYVHLHDGYADADIAALTVKQKSIVDELQSCGKPIAELAGTIKSPYSTIKSLVKKGIVSISDSTVLRSPLRSPIIPFSKITVDRLTDRQKDACHLITSFLTNGSFTTLLLHGVTGSGKTEVYIHSIKHAVKNGMDAIVLVPEISLTPQLVERFTVYFGDRIAVLHSRLSKGERADEWRRIKEKKASIAIGTRSAIFAPFDNLGIIIVDEEHDASYKQSVSPCYNARDCAVVLGKLSNSVVVLGSATPSIESYYNYRIGKYRYFSMEKRIEGSSLPEIRIIDKRKKEDSDNKWEVLSPALVQAIKQRMEKREQSILFLNRRGAAPFLQCVECGYVCICKNCSVSLTLHSVTNNLRCHYCDFSHPPLERCPSCGGYKVYPFGVGTQGLENEIIKLFPQANVLRMDKDSINRKDSYHKAFEKFRRKEVDILIGTQIVTKGHDFPDVTLVGVVFADVSLNIPDFRAGERTFHLLTQVAGRAGRRERKGEVFIQTCNPGHYSVRYAAAHDYAGFYAQEIAFREEWNYPPFSRIAALKCESASRNDGEIFLKRLSRILSDLGLNKKGVEILGPARAPLFKIKNRYRWNVMLKSKRVDVLSYAIVHTMRLIEERRVRKGNIKLLVDVDPVDLL